MLTRISIPVALGGALLTTTGCHSAGDANGSGGPGQDLIGSCADSEPVHSGQATYYTFADGSGACSFDPTPNDLMVGAMNAPDYLGSAVCGACAAIDGPLGSVTIRVVDLCPECPSGNIDLSPDAFSAIANLADGRVDISWRYVPCNVQGPVEYHFKEGSNQWWTAVQMRNHRYAIATLEYLGSSGGYVSVAREDYNFFVEPAGMGPGPYSFRVTDVKGQVVSDTGVPFVEAGTEPGAAQFPACP